MPRQVVRSPCGGGNLAVVLIEDVRRRNRRRAIVLASVAAVNYWLVVSFVAGLAAFAVLPTGTVTVPLAAAGGAVLVAAYLWWAIRTAARWTVRDLGARVLTEGEWPKTGHLVEELALATGTPPARVAYLEDPVPNALTVGAGPRSSVIVITTGLVAQLTRDELEAVLAVQLCEIARLDVALRTVVVACSRGSSAIFEFFYSGWKHVTSWPYLVLTWPSMAAGDLLRRAVYRSRDFGADDMAVSITRNPAALRSALRHLAHDPGTVAAVTAQNAPLWFEPVPESSTGERPMLLHRYAMTPSLDDRAARLDHTR